MKTLKKGTNLRIRKSILLGTFAAALFLGTMLFLTPRPRPVEPALSIATPTEEAVPSPATESPPSLAYSGTALMTDGVPGASVPPRVAVVDLPEAPREPANAVRVQAGTVLAKVNDQAILLADLVPLQADESEQAMTPEEYESRLNRAIEMELTFQAAAVRGIGLTAEQSKRLDSLAQKHEAAFQEYSKQGITWSSLSAVQVEFEQRLTAALMLQQNILANEAGVAPSPDAGIQARYEQALRGMLDRLKANGNITSTSVEL